MYVIVKPDLMGYREDVEIACDPSSGSPYEFDGYEDAEAFRDMHFPDGDVMETDSFQ